MVLPCMNSTVMIVHSFPVLFRCEMVKRSNLSLSLSRYVSPPPPSTVKNLLNSIPSLQDKISEVEELSSQLSPVTNVSDNINRIKELIEQARDAANRVRMHHHTHTTLYTPWVHTPTDIPTVYNMLPLPLAIQSLQQ